MSHQTEKTTFGLTVEPTLNPKSSQDSGLSIVETTGTATPKSTSDPANPYSAFYTHPSARRSREDQRIGEKIPTIAIDAADLEALTPPHHSTAHLATPKVSMDGRAKECTMWPSRQTLVAEEKKKRRVQRHCKLYSGLSTKQRLWAKILVALFIISAAVGLGVGISRAVGGGVWSGNGQTKAIPVDHHT